MAWIEGNQKKFVKPYENKDLAQTKGFLEEKDVRIWTAKFLKENLPLLVKMMTGIDLLPFQNMMIKAMMNSDYFLAVISRGGGKSFLAALFLVAYATINQGVKIGILANSFRQSRLLMQKILDLKGEPEAKHLNKCVTGVSLKPDEWVLEIGRSKLVALPLGDGCLNPSSRITYDDCGIKTMGEFLPDNLDYSKDHQEFTTQGRSIWSNGRFRETDQQFYNGIRDTKKLVTSKGFSIESTLNHKFKTVINGEISWKQADQYFVGDNILIDKSIRWHSNDTDLTEDECYAMGALIGDGSFLKSSTVGFATKDEEIIEYLKLGTPFSWVQTSDGVHWNGGGGNKLKYEYLSRFNYRDESLWKTENKAIPSKILASSKPKMSAFIRGLFDTDGCVQVQTAKGGTSIAVAFYNTSERLINDLQYVLLHYGIVANKSARDRKFDKRFGEVNWKRSYELHITGSDILKFYQQIGFRLSRKSKVLEAGVESKKRWNSISDDSVPVTTDLLSDIARNQKAVRIKGFRGVNHLKGKKFITKYQLGLFIAAYSHVNDSRLDLLRTLLSEDIYFDEIKSITDGKCPTVDVHVPDGHEYCANGFFSHNSKLRGYRFQVMVLDELLLFSEKILNEVVLPFLAVVTNPTERKKMKDAEDKLIEQGKMKEEDRMVWKNNKVIGLSSASYKFEYLYKLYCQYEENILKNKNPKAKYAIFHMAYEALPPELYDEAMIGKLKGEMSEAQYAREMQSKFTDDSSGYFKMSKMQACTYPDGEGQAVMAMGEAGETYILSIDASWSESESSDDFAMHVIKYFPSNGLGVVVHSYALPGTALKEHIKYFHFLYKSFSPELVVMDYNGGVQFLSAVNESELFKSDKIEIKTIDIDTNDATVYQDSVKQARNSHNKSEHKVCIQCKPLSDFIRRSNELLQAAYDHKRIMFASGAVDEEFQHQISLPVPVKNLKFLRDNLTPDPSVVDFVENLKDNIEMIKVQCAMIEVSTTPQGTQTFDLPTNLKRQRGQNKARRDSYSAMVLGNWGLQFYRDMLSVPKEEEYQGWTPEIF